MFFPGWFQTLFPRQYSWPRLKEYRLKFIVLTWWPGLTSKIPIGVTSKGIMFILNKLRTARRRRCPSVQREILSKPQKEGGKFQIFSVTVMSFVGRLVVFLSNYPCLLKTVLACVKKLCQGKNRQIVVISKNLLWQFI